MTPDTAWDAIFTVHDAVLTGSVPDIVAAALLLDADTPPLRTYAHTAQEFAAALVRRATQPGPLSDCLLVAASDLYSAAYSDVLYALAQVVPTPVERADTHP